MRNKLIVAAVIVVGVASVAYAAFTQTLTINGSGTIGGNWNVHITSITQTAQNGATENSAPSFTGTTASFDDSLAFPGASASYDIVISNTGSIPALLSSIDGLTQANAAAPLYLGYTMTGLTAGSTALAAGATNTAHVTVTWDSASNPNTTGETKAATITLVYDQNTT